ncbi:segregation and condensation protein B [Rhizobium sp. RU35A]|uniref:SMC-Scp complex subunit ScpB n=1 Tax=Rhizobium straminoryzae TaxID=1387186 RepID=A0A549THT7_9HYPH|nr:MULTISPECIES: SMC-Scp complex subunit ScpB [Rhizobium]TRL42673.1 SMC-Scp complex subunit ScpB [Rhizobium straminoryzae]SIQ89521.1 segregation and condensation protein B [Rhizobium sp. RU35A]
MARTPRPPDVLDTDLPGLSPEARWREWMNRVEAVIFASSEPVGRAMLARVVGRDCDLDRLIEDIQAGLATRPFEIVSIAGGFQYRTRPAYAAAVRVSGAPVSASPGLSQHEATVLMVIGYFQPVTRSELSRIFGREVSRDTIAALRRQDFIAAGPRSPLPGAPYTYVTTPAFLAAFGLSNLRDLPDLEMLEDAGLLSRHLMRKDALSDLLEGEVEEE